MHAVDTNRSQNSERIGDTVKHVPPAARQWRSTESELLLDLDRRGELAALRVYPAQLISSKKMLPRFEMVAPH